MLRISLVPLALWLCSAPALAQGDTCATAELVTALGSTPLDVTGFGQSNYMLGSDCDPFPSIGYIDGFYEFVAPESAIYIARVRDLGSSGQLAVYRGGGCSAVCEARTGVASLSILEVAMGDVLLMRVNAVASDTVGRLVVTKVDDPCLTVPPDAFEPNDICGSGPLITPGTLTGLNICYLNQDVFSIDVPAGKLLSVSDSEAVLDSVSLRLTNAACQPLTPIVTDGNVRWQNLTGALQTVQIVATFDIDGFDFGTTYDLTAVVRDPGCAAAPEDALEENDTCAEAIELALGTFQGLKTDLADPDFFSVTVPAMDAWRIVVVQAGEGAPILCGAPNGCSVPFVPVGDVLEFTNNTAAPVSYLFEVAPDDAAFSCAEYELRVQDEGGSSCFALPPDMFEPNNTCAGAKPIPEGSYTGLNVRLQDEDYYSFNLPPDRRLTVSLNPEGGGDTDLDIYSENCKLIGIRDTDSFTFTNPGATATNVIFTVYRDRQFPGSGCAQYGMVVSMSVDECRSLPDDTFEPTNSCSGAFPLGSGVFPQLEIRSCSDDFYTLLVPAGGTLEVDSVLTNNTGRGMIQFLQLDGIGCGVQDTDNMFGDVLDLSLSTGGASTSWTNASSATVEVFLSLAIRFLPEGETVTYDLDIRGALGPRDEVGSSFCAAIPNSTGSFATTQAIGRTDASDNTLRLRTTSLPSQAAGFYLVSDTPAVIVQPGGSVGTLCLGGTIGRFIGPGQVQNSGPLGEFALDIDLTMIPRATSFAAVMAGDVWNFTAWHRDNGPSGATSNFSTATSIFFE